MTSGSHDMDGKIDQGVDGEADSNGVKTVDASQVAEKVCPAIVWCNSKQLIQCCLRIAVHFGFKACCASPGKA